jgi:hypothetical protein
VPLNEAERVIGVGAVDFEALWPGVADAEAHGVAIGSGQRQGGPDNEFSLGRRHDVRC